MYKLFFQRAAIPIFNRKGVHGYSDCPADSDKTWILVKPTNKLQKG